MSAEEMEGPTMITFRRADGELVAGEFMFVTGLEWFETDDEPTELVKQTWRLVESETITVNATNRDEGVERWGAR